MVQVPDWSKDEFENRSGALARLVRLAWRAIARAFAGRLESQVVATSADVAGLPAAWDMEVEAQILGYVTDTYLDAASKMRTELDAPDDFIPTDDLVAAYLRTARNRLRNIGDDVWKVVSEQLIQGISAGESIPELAARVRNTAGVSDARSLTIARTEVHAAHEAGSYDQALFVDPDASKIWLATEDARTRPTHQAAEGQRRKINESFEVGGAALRYPGDPLGPADEVINCRCTTVYDFGTLDSVTSDDPELALVAASKKKWTPSKHPRGADGKFIKKGAVADFLAKPKPTLQGVAHAIDALDEKSWGQLTDAQQDYIRDSYGKLPKGSSLEKQAAEKLSKIGALGGSNKPSAPLKAADVGHIEKKDALELYKQLVHPTQGKGITLSDPPEKIYQAAVEVAEANAGKKSKYGPNLTAEDVITITDISKTANIGINATNKHLYLKKVNAWIEEADSSTPAIDQTPAVKTPAVPKAKVLAQAAPSTNKAAKTILEADDFAELGNQKYKKPLGKTGKPLRVGFLGDDGSITAHVGSKPGDPAKSSTFLIWGKYPPGTTILESADGNKSVVWNGKKYEFREEGQATQALGKQAAYDKLHGSTEWVVPKYEGQPVDQPGVLTELVEGYKEPDDEVDTDLPDEAPAPEPTPAIEPEPAAPEAAQVSDVAPVSEPEPEVSQATEPEPDVLQQLMDGTWKPTAYDKALQNLKNGYIKPKEAVDLATGMTQAEWDGLTADQRSKITLGTDLALDDDTIDSQDAWLAYNKVSEFQAKQTAPAPAPSPAMQLSAPEVVAPVQVPPGASVIGQGVDDARWSDIGDNAANGLYPPGSVVAQTADGQFKLVSSPASAMGTWSLQDAEGNHLVTLTDANVDAGWAEDYGSTPWYALPPSPSASQPISPSVPESETLPTPGTITDEGEWVAIAANEFWPAGAVVAETTDGEFKLTKGFAPNTWYLKDYNNETITSLTDADVEGGLAQSETPFHEWKASEFPAVPEPAAVQVADEDTGPDESLQNETDWLDLIDTYANVVSVPTVVAQADNGDYRLVVHPDGAASLEWNTAGSWIDIETFDPNALGDFDTIESLVQSHTLSSWSKIAPEAVTPAVAPEPAAPSAPASLPGVSSGSLTPQEIGSLLAQPHPAGTVIAINDDGDLRLLANGDGTFSTEFINTSGTWEPLSKNYSQANIQNSFETGKWTVSGDLVANIPPAPVTPATDLSNSTQFTLSAGKMLSELESYTNFAHPAGTIIGVTPDGNQRLVSNEDGAYVLQMRDAGGNWFDGAVVPPSAALAMLHQNPWMIPDNIFDTTVPAASVPSVQGVDWPTGTIFQTTFALGSTDLSKYAGFDHPAGRVVAQRNLEGVNVRVVATGLSDPAYKQEIQSLTTGLWQDGGMPTLSKDQFHQELMSNSWVIPQLAFDDATDDFTPPTPAPPMVELGGDTSGIPLSTKKAWKKKLSAAKVAYYSKPEKIWDQIKEIQDQYPDPMNPGHSKLTPLQVIKSLDEVYTGKTLTNPYETKMVPWAASPKGMAYTGNTGGTQVSTPNAPNAAQTAPPPAPKLMENTPQNVDKLFVALQDMEPGTILATNPGDGANQYQIVVGEAFGGAKTAKLQYKTPTTNNQWVDGSTFPSAEGLTKVLQVEFNNQPWSLAVVQLPNGGVPTASGPVPSVPTPTMQPISTTMTSATTVWSKIGSLPEDTVLATNPGGLNQYRMVVKTDPNGTPYIQIQRKVKSEPNAPWIDVFDVLDAVSLHDALNDSMGGNDWQLFNPQIGTPDTPTAPPTPPAPAGPPPPKAFMTTVKGIYAVMPTLKTGQTVAVAEVNGEKYSLVVGYGYTKKGYYSTKKKLILKKQMPSGSWAMVQQLDTQVKLGAVLKDPKYAWVEAQELPAVPPPSVAAPVTAPKSMAATTSLTYPATNEGIEDLWNHLDEIGDGVTIATTKLYGDQITLKSSTKGGKNSIISISSTGTQTVADSVADLKALLVGGTWDIKATKSPLFGVGDIADLSEGKKQDLYTKFKGQPATYLDSPAASIYGALSYIANENGVTLLQMIRVIDDIGAKKVNKPDEHLFEKKIKDWLKTPQGAAVVMGKPVPMPDQPDLLPSVDPKKIMPLEESDKLSYKTISVDKAQKLNAEFKAASPAGKWNAAQEHGLAIYTGGTYISINNYYRGKTNDITSANQQAAQEAQQAMRPSTVPMLLHRGVGYDGIGGANSHADIEKRVGQTWQGGGFFSTSVGGNAAFGGPVLIELEAPPGTPMAFVDSPSDVDSYKGCVSVNCGEREMLLAAGLYYKIISVKYEGGKSVVRLRVVPTPDEEEE